MAENRKEDDSEPNQQNDPDRILLGLRSDNCQNEKDAQVESEEKIEPSGEIMSDNGNENEQQQSHDEKLRGEILGSGDINFAIDTMKKEAKYDEISVKQLFYGFCSAFTKWPIPHTINSRDSGAGKTYLLDIVARYFPSKYITYLAGMSDKAIVHRPGILVISEYNEETDEEEIRPIDPVISDLQLQIEDIQGKKSCLEKIEEKSRPSRLRSRI